MVEFKIDANGEVTATVRQEPGQMVADVYAEAEFARTFLLRLNYPQPEQPAPVSDAPGVYP